MCSAHHLALVALSPPANAGDIEAQARSLGGQDPLEKEVQPTPVFLPGESHGQRNLAGYSPQGHEQLNTTEVT